MDSLVWPIVSFVFVKSCFIPAYCLVIFDCQALCMKNFRDYLRQCYFLFKRVYFVVGGLEA